MITLVRSAVRGQFGAALGMLERCVRRAEAATWLTVVGQFPFWHVAYHATFYDIRHIQHHAGQLGAVLRRRVDQVCDAASKRGHSTLLTRWGGCGSTFAMPRTARAADHAGRVAGAVPARLAGDRQRGSDGRRGASVADVHCPRRSLRRRPLESTYRRATGTRIVALPPRQTPQTPGKVECPLFELRRFSPSA